MLRKTSIIVILFSLNICNFCIGQIVDSTDYLGTWDGGVIYKLNGIKHTSSLIWRIHKIDNKEKVIELTELGDHFDNQKEIINPEKRIYRGWSNKDGIHIILQTSVGNDVAVDLKRARIDEISFLKTSNESEQFIFYLSRWDRNIGVFIKPKNPIKVEIIRKGIL